MAVGVGFEPTKELPPCWFSRPVPSAAWIPYRMLLPHRIFTCLIRFISRPPHSTTLPPLHGAGPRQTETDSALNYKVSSTLTPSFDTAVDLEIWHNYPR